jgi:hypothetical protein
MTIVKEIANPVDSRANVSTKGIPRHKPFRVLVHGLTQFCQKLPGLLGNEQWEIRDRSRNTPAQLANLVRDFRECDLVFTWAGRIDMGRFLWGARSLRAKKIVIFWCGSDVLRAQKVFSAGEADPWVSGRIHWAASPSLAQEVRALGIPCEFVQASFVEEVANPKPLPKTFSVLTFLPWADRAELYGWDRVIAVARALPDMSFKVVGLHKGQSVDAPPNVTAYPWAENLTSTYEQSTVLWRPVRHDAGISFMVLEALAQGRHVLYTYPVPGAVQVKGTEEAREKLQHLRVLHDAGTLPLNHAGRETVTRYYRREVVREELHRRWEEIILS